MTHYIAICPKCELFYKIRQGCHWYCLHVDRVPFTPFYDEGIPMSGPPIGEKIECKIVKVED
jgi:hypothetical protein